MPIITDHRPKRLKYIIGNKNIVNILQKMAKKEITHPGKISKAILFHGQSGCGKTTMARLFAKEIGIDKQNIIEVDISDNRGIDAVREIKKSARYKPIIGGEKKAYILDEFQGADGGLVELHHGPSFFVGRFGQLAQPEAGLVDISPR